MSGINSNAMNRAVRHSDMVAFVWDKQTMRVDAVQVPLVRSMNNRDQCT